MHISTNALEIVWQFKHMAQKSMDVCIILNKTFYIVLFIYYFITVGNREVLINIIHVNLTICLILF